MVHKISKSIYRYLLFTLSPLLTLPFVIIDNFKQKKSGIILVTLFFALLSYYYVPYSFFDKVHYYRFYNEYLQLSFVDFLSETLLLRTDFIIYFIVYIFSFLGISFHLVAALITTITMWCYLSVFYSIAKKNKIDNRIYLFCFIVILLSISYFHLLTGIRYYFASGFIIKGFYAIYIRQKKKYTILYFSLGILSHFGAIIFLPFLFLFSYLKEKQIKLLFIISTVFVFLARDILYNVFSASLTGGLYERKLDAYFGANDFIEKQLLNDSVYYEYKVMLTIGIHIVMLVYLLVNSRSKSKFYLMTLVFLMIGNLMRSAPTIFERISLINNTFIFILCFMIQENKNIISKIIGFIFFGFILLLFALDFLLLYASYVDSYNLIDFLIFPKIIFNKSIQYHNYAT